MAETKSWVTTGKFTGISGDTLKVIAMVTMFIDHFAHVFISPYSDLYLILRGIGRLAFPLYCFLLVEGFLHTKNYNRYVLRMALFALIAEIPFDLALYGVPIYWGYQSVMLTLLIGLIGLGAYRWCVNRQLPIYGILVAVAAILAGWLTRCDYGAEGVLLIFIFYLFSYSPTRRAVGLGVWAVMFGGLEVWGACAVLPIALYSGARGKGGRWFKWFGYAFYPLHLFLLWLVKIM
ncbi:MAG: hypothetical protein IJZ85_09535 [Lachnospiraceae bacterium]|nr:hypothetical protein [Lachnospiraceae bacterium]